MRMRYKCVRCVPNCAPVPVVAQNQIGWVIIRIQNGVLLGVYKGMRCEVIDDFLIEFPTCFDCVFLMEVVILTEIHERIFIDRIFKLLM